MGAGYRFLAKKADDSAEIQIYEDVGAGWFGGVTAKQVADDLKAAGRVATLDVRINSYGGDVAEGMAIYRRLAEHSARKVVHVDGIAASIASVIAMAGDEIVIGESAQMMIHDAWTIAAGNADDFEVQVANLRRTSALIADIYVARTGNSIDQVKSWMKETKWFTGQEAKAAGFADSVAGNVGAVASASLWLSHMQGRITTQLQAQRADATAEPAAPHPANDDVRKALNNLTSRLRMRAATQSRGSGS